MKKFKSKGKTLVSCMCKKIEKGCMCYKMMNERKDLRLFVIDISVLVQDAENYSCEGNRW